MRASITVGPVLGLTTTLTGWFWLSYLALAVVAAILAGWLVRLPLGYAVVAGLLSALVLLVSEWLHQFGHSLAARWVGHPMLGIRFYNLFSASLYPPDEPALPPAAHMRRALGGFWINLVIGLLLLPVALKLWPAGQASLPPLLGLAGWLAGYGAVINLLVLGLGALLPLKIPGGGLNDGATLLKYWTQAGKP